MIPEQLKNLKPRAEFPRFFIISYGYGELPKLCYSYSKSSLIFLSFPFHIDSCSQIMEKGKESIATLTYKGNPHMK
jgi:hypothetical protein